MKIEIDIHNDAPETVLNEVVNQLKTKFTENKHDHLVIETSHDHNWNVYHCYFDPESGEILEESTTVL